MVVHTQRFGDLDVDPATLIQLDEGLLGFPEERHYCLLESTPGGSVRWMQSVERPELAFLVVDPYEFFEEYEVHLSDALAAEMALDRPAEAAVLALLSIQEEKRVTANLLGPVVINTRTRRGKQVVLDDARYGTRHELLLPPARVCAGSAA